MNLDRIYLLRDTRIGGLSISALTTIGEYVEWFNRYGRDNKLDEQRPQLHTRSANMIRQRMVEDLKTGALIPPLVIGFTTNALLNDITINTANQFVNNNLQSATVIDGMQRSGALEQALEQAPDIAGNILRIDIWVSNNTVGLIYRMLVLNTGQTPWDIKRQMEVIYKPLIEETKRQIPEITINERNDGKRRTNGGEYPASSIVELFIAFSSRKEQVNNADRIADDFTKLDITQMAGEASFSQLFFDSLKLLVAFDIAIARYRDEFGMDGDDQKFMNGMDIFTNMPAKIGFMVALSLQVLGRAGSLERSEEEKQQRIQSIQSQFAELRNRIEQMDNQTLGNFLQLGLLNEMINMLPVKKIGNAQREFFRKGFSTLVESSFAVENLEVVWRAY